MLQNVQFPDGNKKKLKFPTGEKRLTKLVQHASMEEKINGTHKAWAMHFAVMSLLSMLVRTVRI